MICSKWIFYHFLFFRIFFFDFLIFSLSGIFEIFIEIIFFLYLKWLPNSSSRYKADIIMISRTIKTPKVLYWIILWLITMTDSMLLVTQPATKSI